MASTSHSLSPAGAQANVTWNTGTIYRWQVWNSSYLTTDGEGVLMQAIGAGSGLDTIWAHNDLSGGGSGYMQYYAVPSVTNCYFLSNTVNPDQNIGVLVHPNYSTIADVHCDSFNSPSPTICGSATPGGNSSCRPLCPTSSGSTRLPIEAA
jgi:hypothetical protein